MTATSVVDSDTPGARRDRVVVKSNTGHLLLTGRTAAIRAPLWPFYHIDLRSNEFLFDVKLYGMARARAAPVKPILVVAGDAEAGDSLVEALRGLGRIAIWVDARESALEMTEAVDFAAVLVNVEDRAAWTTCVALASRARCPVAVVTTLLARDRRYRNRAFKAGVSAYVCRPCTSGRLRALLARLSSGETAIEMTDGAAYSA